MRGIVPPIGFRGVFRADDDARAVYSEAAGIGRAIPRAVALPADADDLSTLVRWASSSGTPLIARGSGSSMPGGAIGDGVIVDLSRWRDMAPVDIARRTIRVGPGVLRGEVDRAAREHGLRFPPDPSSGAFCTIGGMASTNAAGSHSMHFGATRRWVRALDCVFDDGNRAELRRGSPVPESVPAIARFSRVKEKLVAAESRAPSVHEGVIKDSSGYGLAAFVRSSELVDLLVGSEGTLALFVDIELDLAPVAQATSSILGAFASLEEAVVAAGRARTAGAVACELLDRTFLDVAASGGAARQVPAGTESALLAEVEADDGNSAEAAARVVEEIFRQAGATTVRIALDQHAETELWELRHAASPILARLDPNLRSMQFVEDCAVAPEKLPAYVRGVREILAANETRGVIFGHAGDSHAHVNALVDVRSRGWRERVDRILDGVTALTSALGGTVAGEHGDGRLRTPLLPRVWSAEVLDRFREVKAAFDPKNIFNPGVKVALAGERALDAIKYDPALDALPSRARAALDRVERDRAYARLRLDLLDEAT
ncbi:MAG TPA: FAD-binding oxidoreductase [Gemmatimonadaceae bacterium]|nr:FAD-binding oxidoreductase [Gemmatimonadaceae bacterium]